MRKLRCGALAAVAVVAATLMVPRSARADDTIKHPGDHPEYSVEIEPHGIFGWSNFYATSTGFGVGGRFSIPVVQNGFIPSLNNNVAVSFGLDFLHYSGCPYLNYGCGANYVFFPVAMQWNFFVAPHWSVFGEPGIFIYHGFFDDTDYCVINGRRYCDGPTVTGVGPAFYAGGRYHFNEHVTLTMRIGYPTISIGASFM